MKKENYLLFCLIALLSLAGCSDKQGKYDSFAQCLTEKGVTMYGTEWCPHCKNQKKMFGSSFKYIDYVDCDLRAGDCIKAGVERYPTWEINGTRHEGVMPLYRLASLSKCRLSEG